MTPTTSYLGLTLAHPFMLGASPLTWHLDNARRLEDGGCAAIVMHSLFEEQLADSKVPQSDWLFPPPDGGFAHFQRPEKFPLGPEEYLEQIRRIKAAVAIPVIGSLNSIGAGDGWYTYAPLLEQAGADAIELNVYNLSTGPDDSSQDIERHLDTFVRNVKARTRLPVAVKLSPFYTAFASLASRLDAASADALVLFNRFYESDIDIESAEMRPNLRLSTSAELLVRLHGTALLAGRVRASLAVTGGVHTVSDGMKALLAGAHAVQMVSAILQQGPQHFRLMEEGLRYWMAKHRYDLVEGFRGRASLSRYANPAHIERMNYLRILQSWVG